MSITHLWAGWGLTDVNLTDVAEVVQADANVAVVPVHGAFTGG